jgi:chaperonin GroES
MLRPLGDHLILKPLDVEHITSLGIIIPDTAKEDRPERGEIVAVGPGKLLENGTRQPVDVKVGDKVVFKKYAPDEIEIEKVKYLVIAADDVMAVIE